MRDDFFNQVAADKAYNLVMNMPEPEAREFTRHVVYGMLHDDIEANRRTVMSKVDQINRDLLTAAMRTPLAEEIVPAIEVVSKAAKEGGKKGAGASRWESIYHPKRDRLGRFSSREERTRHGQQAAGQRKLRGEMRRGGVQAYQPVYDKKGKPVVDKDTGEKLMSPIYWDETRRAEMTGPQSEAAFDLVQALSGNTHAAGRAGDVVGGVKGGGSAFEQKWHDASEDEFGTNARTYRRIEAGAQLLGQIDRSPQGQIASQLGQFVGEHGPMAEKVLGPHARRTAYRYRGTEKPPNKDLVDAANYMAAAPIVEKIPLRSAQDTQKVMAARERAFHNLAPEPRIRAARDASMVYFMNRLPDPELSDLQQKSGRIPPSEGVIIDRNGKIVAQASGFADDHYLPFNLRNLQALQGGAYVRTRTTGGLTTEDIYTGLLSGAREVTVISHSGVFTVNFEEDFRGARRYNDKAKSMVERYAKTLDAVKSGQAERRKLDPGTKAAIRQEVVDDMSGYGATREEIETAYRERLKRFQSSPMPRESELKAIEAEAEEVGRQATADGKNGKRAAAEYYNQKIEELEERQVNRFYQLDGQGYAAALRALKEQYPYYIKDVEYKTRRTLKDFGEEGRGRDFSQSTEGMPTQLNRFSRAADAGYVAARHIRPEKAMEGYYDKNIAGEGYEPGTGKTPAAFTNYANWEHNPTRNRRQRGGEQAPAAEGERQAKPGGSSVNMPDRVRNERAAAEKLRRQEGQKKEVKELLDEFVVPFRASGNSLANFPTLSAYANDPDEVLSDPEKRRAAVREASAANDIVAAQGTSEIARTAAAGRASKFRAAIVRMEAGEEGTAWNPEKHMGLSNTTPYAFDRPGFRPGDPPEEAQKILTKMDEDFVRITGGRRLSDMSDAELRRLATTAGRAHKAWRDQSQDALIPTSELAAALVGTDQAETKLAELNRLFSKNPTEAQNYTKRLVENVEKARALKERIAQAPKSSGQAPKAGGGGTPAGFQGLPQNATADDLAAMMALPSATRPTLRSTGGVKTAPSRSPQTQQGGEVKVPRNRLKSLPGFETGYDLDDEEDRDFVIDTLANSLDDLVKNEPEYNEDDIANGDELLSALYDDRGKAVDKAARRLVSRHRNRLDDFTIKLLEGMFL